MNPYLLLSVDPAVRRPALAFFQDGTLRAAELLDGYRRESGPEQWEATARAVVNWPGLPLAMLDEVLIEVPVILPAAQQKGPQEGILQLACTAAAIATAVLAGKRSMVRPRDWKGTTDADEFIERRIKPALTPEELKHVTLPAPSLQHNVWDAIGIGLWRLGRLNPRRVYPR